jgi:hypothetical protein
MPKIRLNLFLLTDNLHITGIDQTSEKIEQQRGVSERNKADQICVVAKNERFA